MFRRPGSCLLGGQIQQVAHSGYRAGGRVNCECLVQYEQTEGRGVEKLGQKASFTVKEGNMAEKIIKC